MKKITKQNSEISKEQSKKFWEQLDWEIRNEWWRQPITILCIFCIGRNWNKIGNILNNWQMGKYRKV